MFLYFVAILCKTRTWNDQVQYTCTAWGKRTSTANISCFHLTLNAVIAYLAWARRAIENFAGKVSIHLWLGIVLSVVLLKLPSVTNKKNIPNLLNDRSQWQRATRIVKNARLFFFFSQFLSLIFITLTSDITQRPRHVTWQRTERQP